tara:strand:- start:1188 stop:1622 length:435 start_codon:yes stop_codon:yes gene_type:complete
VISRFKIQIQEAGGQVRWVDSDKLFAHLMERYTKTIPNGDKPKPYKEKVEHFFATVDIEWTSALRKAYPNVDIDTEMNKAKMWLLSNSPKRNLKKFVNNWLAKAMGQKKNIETEAVIYEKYVPPVINKEDIATPEEIKEILRRK